MSELTSAPAVIAGSTLNTSWEKALLAAPLSNFVSGDQCDDRSAHDDYMMPEHKAPCWGKTPCSVPSPMLGAECEPFATFLKPEDKSLCMLTTSGVLAAEVTERNGLRLHPYPIDVYRLCCLSSRPAEEAIDSAPTVSRQPGKSQSRGYCFQGILERMMNNSTAEEQVERRRNRLFIKLTSQTSKDALRSATPTNGSQVLFQLTEDGVYEHVDMNYFSSRITSGILRKDPTTGKVAKIPNGFCPKLAMLTDGSVQIGAVVQNIYGNRVGTFRGRFLSVVGQSNIRRSLMGRYVNGVLVNLSTDEISAITCDPRELGSPLTLPDSTVAEIDALRAKRHAHKSLRYRPLPGSCFVDPMETLPNAAPAHFPASGQLSRQVSIAAYDDGPFDGTFADPRVDLFGTSNQVTTLHASQEFGYPSNNLIPDFDASGTMGTDWSMDAYGGTDEYYNGKPSRRFGPG